MKTAAFALVALVFALGLASTFGDDYDDYFRFNYGHSGYPVNHGRLERTVHIPYAVPVPQVAPPPAYGAVGGSTGGLFGSDESRKYF